MMSLAAAQVGAEVTHLDASPKSNGYGKEHAAMSGLEDAPIRWIADDAMKFTAREIRRGNTYDAIVLDPPKFGRGTKNETWRFEEDLPGLLENVRALLSPEPLFGHPDSLCCAPVTYRAGAGAQQPSAGPGRGDGNGRDGNPARK